MCVEILGYSERGMVNALCHDILSRRDLKQVETFLSWFDFSHLDEHERPCFSDVKSARLIVEQSFSDFGDLDLLILLEHRSPFCGGRAPEKQAVLIEAKVSTDTDSWQTLGERFEEFMRLIDGGEGSNSNLFVQLHRKVRLVEYLTGEGGAFLPDRFTPRGSLGTNHVVGRAKEDLKAHVTDGGRAWFAAIVPDGPDEAADFARELSLNEGVVPALPRWDARRLGFLSWKTVHDRAVADGERWPLTKATFRWNEGQIYRGGPPVGHDVRPGQILCHDLRQVFVVPARIGHRCRVAKLQADDPVFFWTTETVAVADLHACRDPAPMIEVPTLPTPGLTYAWTDRKDGLPPTNHPHPADMVDGTVVQVLGPSWLTTRVRRADGPPEAPSFLVYTHYLKRRQTIA